MWMVRSKIYIYGSTMVSFNVFIYILFIVEAKEPKGKLETKNLLLKALQHGIFDA